MASRTARTSSTIGSGDGMLLLHQLHGCTEHRRIVAGGATESLDLAARSGVGDVSAVPGEKVVEPVNGGDGDVERICARLGWKPSGHDEMATERYRLLRRVEDRRFS